MAARLELRGPPPRKTEISGSAILEAFRSPCLVITIEHNVVLANRSARKLFRTERNGHAETEKPLGKPLAGSKLPNLLQMVETNTATTQSKSLAQLIDEHFFNLGSPAAREDLWSDSYFSRFPEEQKLPLQVALKHTPGDQASSYEMTIQPFIAEDSLCLLLTLSPLDWPAEKSGTDKSTLRSEIFRSLTSQIPYSPTASMSASDSVGSSVRNNASSKLSRLGAARFAQLRDAVYFNAGEVPGFLFSADEKLYAPNSKKKGVNIEAVEIPGDPKEWFTSMMTVWDKEFTRKLDYEEYPSVLVLRRRGDVKNYRVGLIHDDGVKHLADCEGEAVWDTETDELLGSLVYVRDLGPYEEVLYREHQQKLGSHEMICQSVPHMMWTANAAGNVDFFSDAWYDFTGLTPETSLGSAWEAAIHPEDKNNLWEVFNENRASADVGLLATESRYRRHDDVYRWMSVRVKPVKGDSGQVLKWYGTLTDIEEIVDMRTEAEEQTKHMANVLAQSSISMFRISTSLHFQSFKSTPLVVPGQTTESMIDCFENNDVFQGLAKFDPKGMPHFEAHVRSILAGKIEVATTEDEYCGIVIRTRLMPDIGDVAGSRTVTGVLGCAFDITDLHQKAQLESENARLAVEERTAKEHNRLKSQFLAHMSHEIRTPIAGVIGMGDLLTQTSLDSNQKELVDCIHISANNLLGIVNDILDFSKVEAGQMQFETIPFNLPSVIQEKGRLLGHTAEKKMLNFSCNTDEVPNDLNLMGDPSKIGQVISNLVTNAIKFTSKGTIEINLTLKDGYALVVVQDTGVGMDKATLARLFEPFRQGDSSTARLYGGTGLGLVISQNVSLMHVTYNVSESCLRA